MLPAEGRQRRVRTVIDESHDQVWHECALDIVHEIAVTDPFFSFPADLVLTTRLIALGDQRRLRAAKVVAEVFHNRGRLCQHERLLGSWSLDGEHGRFAEWMNLLQFRRRQLIRTSLICLQLIVELEFLQKPEDTVTPRLFEPGGMGVSCFISSIPTTVMQVEYQ